MAAIARRMGCRDWLLAAIALGCCPVFFISSVTTKDFTLACAFVLLPAIRDSQRDVNGVDLAKYGAIASLEPSA